MSIRKRIISAVTVAALVLGSVGLTGCSASVGTALTIDGEDIPAGVYILYSGYAYSDAYAKFKEEQPDTDTSVEGFDYYAQTVSGMSFGDYVKQEALNYCKRHVALNRMYESYGIVSDAGELDDMNDSVNAQWDFDVSSWAGAGGFDYLKGCNTLSDYYESIGVSKSSFKQVNVDTYRVSEIFDYYYGEGGTQEVSKDEIKGWIDENYSLVRYFAISLNDSDGNLIETPSEVAILENLANEYAEKLNGGESFKDIYNQYQEYQTMKDSAEGEDDAAAADNTEETEDDRTDDSFNSVISKSSTSPSEEFVKALFEQTKKTAAVFKADTAYYVVQRLDILETEGVDEEGKTDYVKNYNSAALQGLKADDFENEFKNEYAGYQVSVNNSTPDYCKQQAENALNGLGTISQIQQYSYYSQLFGGQG